MASRPEMNKWIVLVFTMYLQSNLSIADMLYNGHVLVAHTLRNRPNHSQTLKEKPLYSGHFYSGHI